MNEWNPPYNQTDKAAGHIDYFTLVIRKMNFITQDQEWDIWFELCPEENDDE